MKYIIIMCLFRNRLCQNQIKGQGQQKGMRMFALSVIGKRFLPMGHFQLFSMILKFSMGPYLTFYTDSDGPFFK